MIVLSRAGLQKTSTVGRGSGTRTRRDVDAVTRRSRHRRRRPVHVTSIQFILSTRVSPSGGDWPDEYHLAAARLYAMFDAIDGQFVDGQLDDHVTWSADGDNTTVVVKPIVDSLAAARIGAVCDIGFQFNASTLLCGTLELLALFSFVYLLSYLFLLARLHMVQGQTSNGRWCLLSSSSVVCNAAGSGRRARGRSGGRHCTAGQHGYVRLGRHLVFIFGDRVLY